MFDPTFSRLLRLMLPGWRTSTVLLLCIGVTAALNMVPPMMIRFIIDQALPQHDATLLNTLVAVTIVSAILAGLAGVYRNYLATVLGQQVVFSLRCRLYDSVLGQSLDFFKNTRSGDIMSRVHSDVGGIHNVVSGTLVSAIANVAFVLSTLAVIFALNWRLALVATVVLPLFVIPARLVGRARTRVSRETQEAVARLNSLTQETLSVGGFLLVRLFGAKPHVQERFAKAAGELRHLTVRGSIIGRWFLMWVLLFVTVGPALIYLVGGHEVIAGRMSVGTVVAFVAYLALLYLPASGLANTHVEISAALALFRRIFEYLDLPRSMKDPSQPARLSAPQGRLRFENVSMTYGGGQAALKNISFEVAPGQMVALVGPSGAGKTTIGYLASRIYDPVEGSVSLDGIDLRQIAIEDLPQIIGSVTQEATLFNASVEENLRYAKQDADMDQLICACKLAHVHEAIMALPRGYATEIGERGYALSGGERQRLSLARVLLRSSRLLILDEATSSLDSQSEALIQAALETTLSGRTSLVIAHRLSTILKADLILVLDRGVIVERGTHAHLLAQQGLYAQLFTTQFKKSEDAMSHVSDARMPEPAAALLEARIS